MKTERTTAIVVLALAILVGGLTPVDSIAGQKSLVGSWIVDVMPDQPGPPPFRNLTTFTSDDLLLNTTTEFGSGNGIWEKTGAREFAVKIVNLVPVGHPFGEGTITVTSTVTVDKGGNTVTGPFTTVLDTANVQATVTGTVGPDPHHVRPVTNATRCAVSYSNASAPEPSGHRRALTVTSTD